MELHNLVKTTSKTKRRVGRGHGSGRSKTSGRGTKGQKARRNIPLHFEGGALALTKRMPFLRSKGRNHSFSDQPFIVNIGVLEIFPAKSVITVDELIKHKLVDLSAKTKGVKILGDGELTHALIIKLKVSNGAKIKIEKAGGRVEI